MSNIVSIFSIRCKKCDNISLKSEKHNCSKPPILQKNRRLVLEIGIVFDELKSSLKPSEISHYLNKKYNSQKYTQYEIRWHLQKNPRLFIMDYTKKYKNKYSEKYYILFSNSSEEQKKKIEQDRTVGYHIQYPKSEWGLTCSIKKTIIQDNKTKEKTLAMIYGKELAESLLEYCKEIQA